MYVERVLEMIERFVISELLSLLVIPAVQRKVRNYFFHSSIFVKNISANASQISPRVGTESGEEEA